MGEDNLQLHALEKYSLLLFSHLKINGVNEVDVVKLATILTESKYTLYNFDLRETREGNFVFDIDSMLMCSYLNGYLETKTRKILLEEEYIKECVLPNFSKEINEIFKHLSELYINIAKDSPKISDRDFIGDLFINYNIKGRGRKNQKDI